MRKHGLRSSDPRTSSDARNSLGPREGAARTPGPNRPGRPALFLPADDEPDLSGLSVLLAEDRPRGRALARRLTRLGAEVTLECSGRSAFAAAMRRLWGGKSFDAVVLDLRTDPAEAPVISAALRDGHYGGAVIAVADAAEPVPPPLLRRAGFTAVAPRSCPEAEVPALLAR